MFDNSMIFSFLILIIQCSNGINLPCSKTGNLSETIDSTTHQCCNGNAELKQAGKECCYGSGEFYFSDYKICCNGTLSDRPADRSISCCNRKIIDDTQYLCCDDAIKPLPTGLDRNYASCCGYSVYNLTEKFCCNNNPETLQKKSTGGACCGDKVMYPDLHWCDEESTIKVKYQFNCGGNNIDLLKQSCCQDVPNDQPFFESYNTRNLKAGCCYDKPMNILTEKCCSRGQIISKDMSCCGAGSFNKTTHVCCKGAPIPRNFGVNACCGPNPYDTSTEGCCDREVYSLSTHQCCRGHKRKVHNKNVTCCGSEELDAESLCCRGITPIRKESPDDDECCALDNGKYLTYNSSVKGCHSAGIFTKGKEIKCGNKLINPDIYLCCYEVKWRRRGRKCCGVGTYEPKIHTCCNSRVFNVPSQQSTCCEGVAYTADNLPERCRRKIYRAAEEKTVESENKKEPRIFNGLCNDIQYDIDDHVCCQGHLYTRPVDNFESPKDFCKYSVGNGGETSNKYSLHVMGLVLLFLAVFN